MTTAPDWTQDPEQVARWRYWIEHDPDAKSWPPPRAGSRCPDNTPAREVAS